MNLSYDQTGRLATTILALNLQGVVHKEIMLSDSMGLCWMSWKQLAGKAAEMMEPVERAKQELRKILYHKNEPVNEFILTSLLGSAIATAPSCSMAQNLAQVFTYLNRILSNRSGNNPGWLVTGWNSKYGEVLDATRQLCLALFPQGKHLTTSKKAKL